MSTTAQTRSTSSTTLSIEGLSVTYQTPSGPVRAAQNINLEMPRGSALGLVGESGSGKTTVGNAIARALPRGTVVDGVIDIDGIDLNSLSEKDFHKYRWTTISMVFQNALEALNPVFTIGHQLVDVLVHRGKFSASDARKKAEEIMRKVDLDPQWLRHYPHELSGGMKQRVMIAMALLCSPKLIIADEPTTALDVIVREQVIELLRQVREDTGVTLLIISHDLEMITRICDNVAVMYAGEIVESGPTNVVRDTPRHPYTRALMDASPSLTKPVGRLKALPGYPPDLSAEFHGCRFRSRCGFATEICATTPPKQGEPSHWSLCHHSLEGGERP